MFLSFIILQSLSFTTKIESLLKKAPSLTLSSVWSKIENGSRRQHWFPEVACRVSLSQTKFIQCKTRHFLLRTCAATELLVYLRYFPNTRVRSVHLVPIWKSNEWYQGQCRLLNWHKPPKKWKLSLGAKLGRKSKRKTDQKPVTCQGLFPDDKTIFAGLVKVRQDISSSRTKIPLIMGTQS